MRLSRPRWLDGLPLLLLPSFAQAHAGGSDVGLINGLLHPVFGLDHLLAMLSVGVVSAQLGGSALWRLPATFLAAMALGGAWGLGQLPLPRAELGIAASVLLLGMSIILAKRHGATRSIGLAVLLFGVFHGHAHGVEIPRSVSPALYTLGFLIGTAVLHIFGLLIGELAASNAWLGHGLRLAGGLVTVSGALFVLQALGAPA